MSFARRTILAFGFALLTGWAVEAASEPPPSTNRPAAKPITTDRGEIGKLLRQWEAEGSAAGNTNDWYDNRDGGHSLLEVAPYPQLQVVKYSDEDRKARRDWALQTKVQPRVVFGNSSTSASATTGGSNPRNAYCERGGLEMLAKQYRANNLYIYPEHHDHDPDTDPDEGYGDLYPANTPYLLISQGSSGSDQPFMRALPFTLAAFRPEVKARLVAKGLLMPTVQMIFRSSCKTVAKPEDYLTPKAHPTVFEGGNVDALRMVKLAHEITADRLPPMAQLELLSHETAAPWRGYFDLAPDELHAETEDAIAMIFRAAKTARRLVVDAGNSFDLNDRPLTYHWVLLRGDPAKVRITPLNEKKSRAEIVLTWHERAPVTPGSALASSRVDIGVFVHNGAYYSAPAFITSYTLPTEARAYAADGRLLEIGYGHGASRVSVRQWPAFLEALGSNSLSPAAKLFVAGLTAGQLDALRQLGADYKQAVIRADAAEQGKKDAEAALKSPAPEKKADLEAAAKTAREIAKTTAKERDDLLVRKLDGLKEPWRDFVARRLRELPTDTTFCAQILAASPKLLPGAAALRRRLEALGIVREGAGGPLELLPLLPGQAPAPERLSPYQKGQLERFHAELLASSIAGLAHSWRPYLADFRLTRAKDWRDVYAYAGGRLSGWTRYTPAGKFEFTADGLVILTRDAKGRCLTGSPVQYQFTPPGDKRPPWDWPPMSFISQPRLVTYEYANDSDLIGKPVLPR
jgi:hypothetical protein